MVKIRLQFRSVNVRVRTSETLAASYQIYFYLINVGF